MAIRLMSGNEVSKLQQGSLNQASFGGLKECIELTVENGELCLEIPFYGNICIDIPDIIPDGTVAKACVEFTLPACIRVTVEALGKIVVDEKFGICNG